MKVTFTYHLGGKHGVPLRRLGDVLLPSPFTARFEFPDDHAVELDVVVKDDAPVCDGIRIQRHPERPSLTGGELRRLPVRDWVNFAVGHVALTRRETETEGQTAWGPAAEDESVSIARAVDKRPRRRTITDELLADVARVYRSSIDAQPREAVSDTFGVSPSMASRYIKLAREKGFLKPAPTRGRAGEQ